MAVMGTFCAAFSCWVVGKSRKGIIVEEAVFIGVIGGTAIGVERLEIFAVALVSEEIGEIFVVNGKFPCEACPFSSIIKRGELEGEGGSEAKMGPSNNPVEKIGVIVAVTLEVKVGGFARLTIIEEILVVLEIVSKDAIEGVCTSSVAARA